MTLRVPAYYLPSAVSLDQRSQDSSRSAATALARDLPLTMQAQALGLVMPEPTAVSLAAVVGRLQEAVIELRRMSLTERITVIDRVATRWLSPASHWRRIAIDKLPLITGYPAAAVSLGLDRLWQALRAPELAAVALHEGAVVARAGAEPRRPIAEHGGGPGPVAESPYRLAVHLLAGNVPGVGIFGFLAALLAGVPSLVKTARREPLLPALVAHSIAAEDQRLGGALAVLHWRGGEADLDAAALAHADVVLAYGRAKTLEAIAAHQPSRLLRFGPRLSVGLVTREAANRSTAESAAFEAALFDQQGCLSPQLLVLEETDQVTTERFTTSLVTALARLADEMPRAPLSLAESTAVWRFLEEQRWRSQEGEPVQVQADANGLFGVVCDRSGTVVPSPLNRHLVVAPVATLSAATTMLTPLTGSIEAVGYAGPERRIGEAAALAAACGAHRLCPLDRMQAPPFAWRQSGHARLACFATPVGRPAPVPGYLPRAATDR